MGSVTDTQLYQILSGIKSIPATDLKNAQERAGLEKISLYEALLRSDVLSDKDLGKIIAYTLKLPFISIPQAEITDDVLKLTPQFIAQRFKVITFKVDEDGLEIATTNSDTTDLFEMLAKKAGVNRYRVYYATDRDIDEALQQYKKQHQYAFEELLQKSLVDQKDPPIAKIVSTIIGYAYVNKASDVHIEPSRSSSLIRFRIDGILHDTLRLPRLFHDQIIARIKVLSRLRTDEHYSAQDGRMRIALEEEDIDVRVSILPTMSGEKTVLRLLTSHYRQFGLSDLGMTPADLQKVKAGFNRPYGMILSTGPTGSGKTTSMYSILKILNTREKNIATIEDPVEYEIEGINQIQTNPKTNLTFANGLRSILRQDPNIIFVGEIRDEETADIAINSAMTGHLVLSTLHTNNAATTLPRLIDMNIEPFLVASTVNVIVAQRLVRKICGSCKTEYELTKTKDGWQGDSRFAAQLTRISATLLNKHFSGKTIKVYEGKGCPVCHQTGYGGRIGVFEILDISPKIEALIIQKASAEAIMKQAVAEGMTTMTDDGLGKVQQGQTTLEEILRVTRE